MFAVTKILSYISFLWITTGLSGGFTFALREVDYALLAACTSPPGEEDLELVINALEKGVDINAKEGKSGQTALMAAVLRGKTIIVSYLLKAGADPKVGEKSGYHPPHGAAFQGRPEVMQILIDSGLDVNTFHDDGYLPFHRACWGEEQRHADTVLVLLKHGIDPEVKSKNAKTCREMTQNKFVLGVLNSWGTENEKNEL